MARCLQKLFAVEEVKIEDNRTSYLLIHEAANSMFTALYRIASFLKENLQKVENFKRMQAIMMLPRGEK